MIDPLQDTGGGAGGGGGSDMGGYGGYGGGYGDSFSPLGGTGYLPGSDPGAFGGNNALPTFNFGSGNNPGLDAWKTRNSQPLGGVRGAPPSNQYFPNLPSLPNTGSGGSSMGTTFTAPNAGNQASLYGPRPGPPGPPTGPGNPYQVPPSGSNPSSTANYQWPNIPGTYAVPPQYPGVAGEFSNWLMSQIGQGVSPFNLGTPLPTGGMTQPGQLTAGMNPLLQQLMQFFQNPSQSSQIPGMGTMQGWAQGQGPGAGALNYLAGGQQGSTLSAIANQGISALPEWKSMIGAQQQNIAQNEAQLKEQFAGMGDLAGSPFGTAMSNYIQQTTADQNALLGQLQQTNILQGQIPAAEQIASMQGTAGSQLAGLSSSAGQFLGGMDQSISQYLQGLNQQAIQNQYGEFVRTQPQYNPLTQDFLSMSETYPPTVSPGSGMGGLGALLSGSGQLAGGLGSLIPALNNIINGSSGGGGGGMCYLTSACVEAKGLPDDCEELETLRWFRKNYIEELPEGQKVLDEYREIAPKIVSKIKSLGAGAKRVFERIYKDLVQDAVYLIQHDKNEAAFALYSSYTNRLKLEYL